MSADPGRCADYHSQCSAWAADGECEKNKGFMLDKCSLACKTCQPCASATDFECMNNNRKQGGYLEIDRAEMKWLGANIWQTSLSDPSPEL